MQVKLMKSSDRKGGSNSVFPGLNKRVVLTYLIPGREYGNVATKETHHVPRPTAIAKQRTIINETAYNYFISKDSIPVAFTKKKLSGIIAWSKLSWKQRLEYHLASIAEFNEFEYEIL